jgi:hypothetical protein
MDMATAHPLARDPVTRQYLDHKISLLQLREGE